MKITINGQTRDFPPDETLETLSKRFCKDPRHVLAELNGTIIGHEIWKKTFLCDGDKLELVSFVGGG